MEHPRVTTDPSTRVDTIAATDGGRGDDAPDDDSPGGDGPAERTPPPEDGDGSKGSGRKHSVQRKPEDQRGRPDPKVKE